MEKQNPNKEAVEALFDERKRFIILGLTGRTGSGCSTVASLISKDFNDFSPPLPKTADFQNDEDRKYKIAYNYLKDNWGQFHHIQLRNLITTFLLEEAPDKFVSYVSKITNSELHAKKIPESYLAEFTKLHAQRILIKSTTEQSDAVPYDDKTYEFYFFPDTKIYQNN